MALFARTDDQLPSLDAPMSGGGVRDMKGATLTFMAGGAQQAFKPAERILSKMGKKVIRCGEAAHLDALFNNTGHESGDFSGIINFIHRQERGD